MGRKRGGGGGVLGSGGSRPGPWSWKKCDCERRRLGVYWSGTERQNGNPGSPGFHIRLIQIPNRPERGPMKASRILLLCLALPFAFHFCLAQTKDAKGCKDTPLIARFPGSIIYECEDKPDKSYTFTDLGDKHEDKAIEGEYLYLWYNEPAGASPAQVNRNLVTAFKTAGYTFLKNNDHGQFTVHMGKTWVEVDVTNGDNYKLHIVKETALTQDVVANAAALSTGIAGAGHIVVNGILFDTGKADVKPESDAALQEVAKLLKG